MTTASSPTTTADAKDTIAREVSTRQLPSALTVRDVADHVMEPRHVLAAKGDDDATAGAPPAPEAGASAVPSHVDLGAFGAAVYAKLGATTTGYILQVRQHGKLVHHGSMNWSRTPVDTGQGWKETHRFHVASVSKLFTAMGMVHALQNAGLSLNTAIGPYLPAAWARGKNVDAVRFGDVLAQRAGFVATGMTTFPAMKALIAKDLTSATWPRYDNVNYSLCRIMIPIVNGTIDKGAAWSPSVNDQIWDAITIAQYRQYVQDHVLTPAGALQAGFQSKPGEALAYRQPHADRKGWDSGDVKTAAGAAGWRLSCKEVLDVMDQFRRRGTIVSPAVAQQMLDRSHGVDGTWPTAAGNLYAKNGGWGPESGELEQAVALFLPNDMEAVVFVNSPIGDGIAGIRGTIIDAYKAALVPNSTTS